MTEKRALELSIEMWKKFKKLNKEKPWLLIGGLKELYFDEILKNNPEYNVPSCGCYLCEFSHDDCTNCPVKNWSIDRKYGSISKRCTDLFSVYGYSNLKEKINGVLEVLKETYNDLYNNKNKGVNYDRKKSIRKKH